LAIGITHLAISLEISATLSYHHSLMQSLVLLIYPVAFVGVGVGALLEQRFFARRSTVLLLRLAGVALGVLLVATLRANFLVAGSGELALAIAAHAGAMGAWFGLLGAALARGLRRARRAAFSAGGWAAHLGGLLAGYVAGPAVVTAIGANAVLASTALSFALLPQIGVVVVVAAFLAADGVALDERLEELREISNWSESRLTRFLDDNTGKVTGLPAAGTRRDATVFRGWSHLAQVRVTERGDRPQDGHLVFYNFKLQYPVQPFSLLERAAERDTELPMRDRIQVRHRLSRRGVYAALPPGGRGVICGVGAGSPLLELPTEPHPGIVVVERDPVVVRFFSRQRPDLNGHAFAGLRALSGDGRRVIETAEQPLDAIILESARFQPHRVMSAALETQYLYTEDALRSYLERLKPTGTLVIEFNRMARRPVSEYLPTQALSALRRIGAAHRSASIDLGDAGRVCIVASPTERGLESAFARMSAEWEDLRWEEWRPGFGDDPIHDYRLTDDKPFFAWITLRPEQRRTLLGIAASMVLIGSLAVVLVGGRGRARSGDWNPTGYTFCIGIGHIAVQIATFVAYRSYFGDEVLTIMRVISYFLLFGAAGSLLSAKLRHRTPGGALRFIAVVTIFGLHLVLLKSLPFHHSGAFGRELWAALTLMPGGLLMGVFFPLAIARSGAALVGRVVLVDALGTFVGYGLLFPSLLNHGTMTLGALGTLAYGLAAALYRPARGSGQDTFSHGPSEGTQP